MSFRSVDFDTERAAVRTFVDRFERGDRHAAVESLIESVPDPRSILTPLFGVEYDGWYALVADDIAGSCLDLSPGWGRTTPLLASLADTVYAAQPTPIGHRFLAARPALEDTDVVPIAPERLESVLRNRSFETVVATGSRSPDDAFFERIDRLADALEPGGTLVTQVDGWLRTAGLTERLGAAGGPTTGDRSLSAIGRSVPARFVAEMKARGFDEVDLIGLLPGGRRYRWAVPADDPDALEWVLETIGTETAGSQLLRSGVSLANKVGLLRRPYPSYVAVCRTAPTANADAPSDATARVLRRGANRSLVFELVDGDLETVRKVPNAPGHGWFNDRAATTLSSLSIGEGPLAGTVPDVDLAASPFGSVLVESPAHGTPLATVAAGWKTPPDPDEFCRVLETGLDWIRTVQRTHAGSRRTLSTEDARRELTPTGFDVTPPSLSGPIEYPAVPAHGDYHPGNVLVDDDGSIARVIDWEYGRLECDPVADPGFYTLKLAEIAFDGFESGLRTAFLAETLYSTRVAEQLVRYCDAIGIRPRTFAAYLGSALVSQAELHVEAESPWRFHANPRENVERLALLYDNATAIRTRLENGRPSAADASRVGTDDPEHRRRRVPVDGPDRR
ncbi:hypothetical protein HTG_04485 [Natrinema mahii]|nr:hypothetical protein HTG_04485 [Natrinema mahii]